MKAYVYVSLKKSVLDPQGKTIQGALKKMGYKGLGDVRQGKYFELTLDNNRALFTINGVRDRLRVLLEINNVLVSSRELPELFRGIVSAIERVIHLDYTSLALLEPVSSGVLP